MAKRCMLCFGDIVVVDEVQSGQARKVLRAVEARAGEQEQCREVRDNMPSSIDKMKLTREQDWRYKLSSDDVELIRRLYLEGETKSALARRFGVAINTVRCYLSDEEREKSLAAMREYSRIRAPRNKEYRARYMRELREYKKGLSKT